MKRGARALAVGAAGSSIATVVDAAGGIHRVSRDVSSSIGDRVRVHRATDEVVELTDGRTAGLAPKLVGPHQRANAAVAALMAHLGSHALPLGGAIERGVARAEWPGRCERIERDGRVVLLDCAHNVDGVAALIEVLRAVPTMTTRDTLVFGALADKAYAPMLEMLAPHFDARFYAEPEGRAPAPAAALQAIAPGEGIADATKAVAAALARTPEGGFVVVAGSIYLIGQVRAWLLGLTRDPAIAL